MPDEITACLEPTGSGSNDLNSTATSSERKQQRKYHFSDFSFFKILTNKEL
jgi:hypothetical protein